VGGINVLVTPQINLVTMLTICWLGLNSNNSLDMIMFLFLFYFIINKFNYKLTLLLQKHAKG
jgi:hypothetical protein